MKKLIFPFIIMAALFFMAACSTKFNIAAPYENITVIDAFLDKADTAHYIRVQKAFLDQNKSSLTMSQTPDSSFYASLNVRIDRIEATDTSVIFDTIHLNRVDLDLEGYPKQKGVFFNSPNYAYKFKNALDPNYFYRIVVTNLATGQVDSAVAPVIDDVTSGIFTTDVLDNPSLNQAGMDFSSTLPSENFSINTTYIIPSNFYFYGQTTPVYVADAVITFNWVDSNITTSIETAGSYNFDLGYQTITNGAVSYNPTDLSLYGALAAGMGTAPAFTDRLLGRCNIAVYMGTKDFYNYQQNSLIQGIGLTGNDIEPVYTNIQGAYALGLYTSRGVHSGQITLTLDTIDSLIASPILASANIKGTSYH